MITDHLRVDPQSPIPLVAQLTSQLEWLIARGEVIEGERLPPIRGLAQMLGINFNTVRAAYKQQAEALIDGGSDVLLVETVFDTLNAKAALFAIEEIKEERGISIPVMLSGTITDASGRTLSGQTAEAFLISVSHFPLLTVGFNCALGANLLQPHLEAIAHKTDMAISAHPNAGLPNAFGEYDESPEQMAEQIEAYMEKNLVNIIGGCCGTTPAHITAIAELAKRYEPRKVKQESVGS